MFSDKFEEILSRFNRTEISDADKRTLLRAHKEVVENCSKTKEILDDIQADITTYQNDDNRNGMSDEQWNELLIERIESSLDTYAHIQAYC